MDAATQLMFNMFEASKINKRGKRRKNRFKESGEYSHMDSCSRISARRLEMKIVTPGTGLSGRDKKLAKKASK